MSNIKSKNTKLEISGFNALKKMGIRFQRHPKGIIGNPDAANKTKKVAIFFDSKFWHGYGYDKYRYKLNDYWQNKIEKTMERDKSATKKLRAKGWIVIRIWEHDLKNEDYIKKIIEKLK